MLNSIVVALNVTDDAKQPVVVAIDMASTSNGRNVANMATSIHGRPMEHLLQWQEQGLVLHNGVQKENSIFLQMFDTIPNLEKNRDLEKKFTCSEQPGTIPSVETSKEFNNTAKVVQNFETTKSFAEKMSDLTKKNTEKFRKPMNNNNLDRGKSL
ncbi:hypothetical protein FACS189456_6940 [Bacteroidia bacterium]|nr:hypothetical protein FACS189456_6940 [Bacteroidia bacterium]